MYLGTRQSDTKPSNILIACISEHGDCKDYFIDLSTSESDANTKNILISRISVHDRGILIRVISHHRVSRYETEFYSRQQEEHGNDDTGRRRVLEPAVHPRRELLVHRVGDDVEDLTTSAKHRHIYIYIYYINKLNKFH